MADLRIGGVDLSCLHRCLLEQRPESLSDVHCRLSALIHAFRNLCLLRAMFVEARKEYGGATLTLGD